MYLVFYNNYARWRWKHILFSSESKARRNSYGQRDVECHCFSREPAKKKRFWNSWRYRLANIKSRQKVNDPYLQLLSWTFPNTGGFVTVLLPGWMTFECSAAEELVVTSKRRHLYCEELAWVRRCCVHLVWNIPKNCWITAKRAPLIIPTIRTLRRVKESAFIQIRQTRCSVMTWTRDSGPAEVAEVKSLSASTRYQKFSRFDTLHRFEWALCQGDFLIRFSDGSAGSSRSLAALWRGVPTEARFVRGRAPWAAQPLPNFPLSKKVWAGSKKLKATMSRIFHKGLQHLRSLWGAQGRGGKTTMEENTSWAQANPAKFQLPANRSGVGVSYGALLRRRANVRWRIPRSWSTESKTASDAGRILKLRLVKTVPLNQLLPEPSTWKL